MSGRFSQSAFIAIVASVLMVVATVVPSAWAQHGSQGKVVVTVADASGGVVPGAQLELVDVATNDTRKAETQEQGAYTFVNLSIGTYRLSVSKAGFKTQVLTAITVQAAQVTNLDVALQVGAVTETVEVSSGAAPLVETTTNAIGSTIDMKSIENLPVQGRNLASLSYLVPGYNGTWSGLPSIAQGSNIDGVIGNTTRMKFSGNTAPVVAVRVENIEEMTVQTDQLDLNQGFGQSNMQVNYVTRRGSNAFHGRLFEDHQNSALNANTWRNDAVGQAKPHLILNDFGASVGGPILKDKLFFFGSFSMSKQPGGSLVDNLVLTPAAQQGDFTYTGTDGLSHTVNVLQTANTQNSSLPGTVNSQVASQLSAINGSLQYGSVGAYTNPNLNNITWAQPSPITIYHPTVRLDYNLSEKFRINFAWNETKNSSPGINQAFFPGPDWAGTGAGNHSKYDTLSLGFDWTISPTIVNQFRGGFLYNSVLNSYNATPTWFTNPNRVSWNYYGAGYPYDGNMSGQQYNLPVNTNYPVLNVSDTMTVQHQAHTFSFGFSWYREQDHYYNPPEGISTISLGLATGDPALQAFTTSTLPNASSDNLAEAQQLYAILAGRVSDVGGSYAYDPSSGDYLHQVAAYNLNELQKSWGVFFQDSYRVKPNLTLNYGLRWDFTGDNHDLTNAYHGVTPEDMFGSSGMWNLFNPGSFNGNSDPKLVAMGHQYHPWNVAPQPAIGVAWTPHSNGNFIERMLGGENTVIRGGYSLRRFTEPQQYFWNNASDYGAFFYQGFYLHPIATSGGPAPAGTYIPGDLALGQTFPDYGLSPAAYLASESQSDFTFINNPGVNGLNPHISQPYTQSWNLGIQRQLGANRALEVRYVGSRTLKQWIAINTNEVNVFENGFLQEFKNAQANYAVNHANGDESFAYNGMAGQYVLPLFDAAFAGGLSDYGNTDFLNMLSTGQAGALGNVLAGVGGAPYFCRLVGSSFTPCETNAGYTGAGAGYPINFFQANGFAAGSSTSYMDSKGFSNYNGLLVDFRQRNWHGMQFDANYTWSHTLGIATQNDWTAATNLFTARNLRRAYGPTLFDIRQVIHLSGTYDLPFGRGKQLLNNSTILDKVVGGWTIGSIFSFQTGTPFRLSSGRLTYNDYADGGINLNGVSVSDLQNAIGVYRAKNATTGAPLPSVLFIDPKYLNTSAGGGANPTYITANTSPGTIGQTPWLYGPHFYTNDMSLTKAVNFTERIKFNFQAVFLNAFNHPIFSPGTTPSWTNGFSPTVGSSGFLTGGTLGSGSPTGSSVYKPRRIELRANIEF